MKYIYTACLLFVSTYTLAQSTSNTAPKCIFMQSNMVESIDSIVTEMCEKGDNVYLRLYNSGQTDKMEIKTVDTAVLLDSVTGNTEIFLNEYLPDTIMGIVATRQHLILILGEYSCNYMTKDVESVPSYYIIPYHPRDNFCAPFIDDRDFSRGRRVYRVQLPRLIQVYPMRIKDDLR